MGYIFGGNSPIYGVPRIPASLKKVIITGGTSIENLAFYGCSGLTEISIPDSVTSIGYRAFYGCSGLTSITIPDGVTSIEGGAFHGCSGLEHITVATSNQKYYSEGDCLIERDTNTVILGCKNSKIPDNVTSIGDVAFYNCSGLASITIPDSVTEIGSSAFENCSGLTSVTIGSGVTSIEGGAFEDCSGLTSVTIGSGVTSIEGGAFEGCSGLTSVYYMGTSDDWGEIVIGSSNSYLTEATRYYYSAEENYDGQHWHYDPATGKPVVWTKEEA